MEPGDSEAQSEPAEAPRARPLLERLLALIALIGLLASGAVISWRVLTDQLELRGAAAPRARDPSN